MSKQLSLLSTKSWFSSAEGVALAPVQFDPTAVAGLPSTGERDYADVTFYRDRLIVTPPLPTGALLPITTRPYLILNGRRNNNLYITGQALQNLTTRLERLKSRQLRVVAMLGTASLAAVYNGARCGAKKGFVAGGGVHGVLFGAAMGAGLGAVGIYGYSFSQEMQKKREKQTLEFITEIIQFLNDFEGGQHSGNDAVEVLEKFAEEDAGSEIGPAAKMAFTELLGYLEARPDVETFAILVLARSKIGANKIAKLRSDPAYSIGNPEAPVLNNGSTSAPNRSYPSASAINDEETRSLAADINTYKENHERDPKCSLEQAQKLIDISERCKCQTNGPYPKALFIAFLTHLDSRIDDDSYRSALAVRAGERHLRLARLDQL